MSLLDYFLGKKKKESASVAKDRLQILFATEHSGKNAPAYLPKLREEILQVVSKYVKIDQEQVNISVDADGEYEVLELNLVLQEDK
jgi:cell division topological specificity factor